MYGLWRLELSPSPSTGATCVLNGLATKTTSIEKNTATIPSPGTTQATSPPPALRVGKAGAGAEAVKTKSQRRRQAPWPPQRAVNLYASGSSRLVNAET